MRRLIIGVAALLVTAAACATGTSSQPETTSVPPTSAPTTTLPPSTTEPSTTIEASTTTAASTTAAPTTEAPTTTAASTTTGASTTSTTGLPGEEMEDSGPPAGATLAVFGVGHDDVLNVRAAPGTDQAIVARLDPLEDDVTALGRTRRLTKSMWTLVVANGVEGWASVRYLLYMGATHDVTSEVEGTLGPTPSAETMKELGKQVAQVFADPEFSTIVMSVAPTTGDLGEVTFDVAGLGDDSVWGVRLHVFGTPADDGFSLKSVESTVFCMRAVDDQGVCV